MAKRKRINGIRSSSDIYEEQPYGAEYNPALLIQDVPSKGRESRIKGIKTNIMHLFMYDLERN